MKSISTILGIIAIPLFIMTSINYCESIGCSMSVAGVISMIATIPMIQLFIFMEESKDDTEDNSESL